MTSRATTHSPLRSTLAGLGLALVATAAVSATAIAAPRERGYYGAAGIEMRIDRQAGRISAGESSGALTRFEAVALRFSLNRIRTALYFAKADGRISEREREGLNARLDRLSDKIFAEKHDRDARRRYRG